MVITADGEPYFTAPREAERGLVALVGEAPGTRVSFIGEVRREEAWRWEELANGEEVPLGGGGRAEGERVKWKILSSWRVETSPLLRLSNSRGRLRIEVRAARSEFKTREAVSLGAVPRPCGERWL